MWGNQKPELEPPKRALTPDLTRASSVKRHVLINQSINQSNARRPLCHTTTSDSNLIFLLSIPTLSRTGRRIDRSTRFDGPPLGDLAFVVKSSEGHAR